VTVARIIAIAVLTHMAFVSARMTGSLYALANNASTFTVGVMMALFALVPMLIAVRAGRWLDAVGPWRPTVTGSLLTLGGMLLPAAFPYATADVAPLLVAAALVGTGQTLVMLSIQQVVGERADPNRRAAAFSWLALALPSPGSPARWRAVCLIDSFGHRATFAVLVGVVLLALALVWANRALLPTRDGTPTGPRAAAPVRAAPACRAAACAHRQCTDLDVLGPADLRGPGARQPGRLVGRRKSASCWAASRSPPHDPLAMPWLSRHFSEWQVLTYTLFSATAASCCSPSSRRSRR